VVLLILIYAIYLESGVYITKCNLGLGFFWKFNVVLRFMWSKVIKKSKKDNGLKKEKLKRYDPLETSSLSLLMIA
jgi:hypothetical protein